MNGKAILAAGILCGAVLASGKDRDPFPEIESALAENRMTEAGRNYADSAAAAFRKDLSAVLRLCRDSTADTSHSEIFLMLSRRGMIKDLVLRPETPAGECLARRAWKTELPPPPGPNHWIRVEMGF